jgi:hypothetical protein
VIQQPSVPLQLDSFLWSAGNKDKIHSQNRDEETCMTDATNEPASLSIIAISVDGSDIEDEIEIRGAGQRWQAAGNLLVGRKDVSLEKIHSELDRVQGELDDVLSKIDSQPKHGFRLSEVAISLGISAEGSIGVVSAGVQAGITLTFSKS